MIKLCNVSVNETSVDTILAILTVYTCLLYLMELMCPQLVAHIICKHTQHFKRRATANIIEPFLSAHLAFALEKCNHCANLFCKIQLSDIHVYAYRLLVPVVHNLESASQKVENVNSYWKRRLLLKSSPQLVNLPFCVCPSFVSYWPLLKP